jgi:hypothetical protein
VFVTDKQFQPSLTFASKDKVLWPNTQILNWKGWPVTNSTAYVSGATSVTTKKKFYKTDMTPGAKVEKLFTTVIYDFSC